MRGYLYILSNKAMPDLLKIGFTTRTIEERVKELNSCQVPCDHIPKRSYPLFKAREALAELINQLQKTAA